MARLLLAFLYFTHAATLLTVAQQLLNSRTITSSRGRNICYDRYTGVPRCCDGYTSAGGGTWNCDNPLCRRGCGDGRCISPNLCACPDGRRASTCPETPSCTNGCQNGGTCIGRNRCRCLAAFGGNLCQTDNCPNGCLNGGRCVGRNQCLCPQSVTGVRCETDNRLGPCYREIRAGSGNQKLCINVVPDVFCSRCLCCQTVGVAWGRPCQKCPQVDAEKGRCVRFSPTNDTYMDSATLQHGDRHLLIVGNSSLPGERKRTLLKYNVSSITRCSLIREVHLLTPVNSTKSLRQANNITAHAVRSDWQESAVSSRHRTSTDDWVEAFLGPANQPPNGVDAKERAEGSEEVTEISVSRSYTPKIKIQTQTVCNWIANPRSGNKGLLLRANCENSSCGEIRFNSRESGLSAPLLEVCLINEGWKDNDCFIHICPRGTRLDANGRFCEGIDVCLRMPNICGKGRGKCINTDGSYECECVRGFTKDETGACAPPELGYCYRQITQHRCSQVLSTRVSKALCCNLVGEGWGMETCSHIHECVEGDRGDGKCSKGFFLNSLDNCEDINECEIFPTICQPYGVCLNTHGGYRCHCNVRGFKPDSTGTRCVDTRPGQCWGRVHNGRCELALGTTSLAQCCCSVGKSWGNPCQLCPAQDTAEFDTLCFGGIGFIGLVGERDINECHEVPGMCRHGYCVNTIGSYKCYCPDGYTMDVTGTACVDKNECAENRQLCGRFGRCVNRLGTYECHCSKGYRKLSYHTCVDIDECRLRIHNCRDKCVNVPGGFRCECARGFFLMPDGLQCRDVNECVKRGTCDNGQCYNTPGSFVCRCNDGYRLTSNRQSCKDINECIELPSLCKPRGTCKNTPGSYKCLCDDGYEWKANIRKCQDKDECALGFCRNGKCVNYFGSFECTCPHEGYALNFDRTHCEDVDECIEDSDLCRGGTCININGSYDCSCPEGFTVFNDVCIDIDECSIPGFCQGGRCINQVGNYTCTCPPGHDFNENSSVCIDMRKDLCYLMELDIGSTIETGSGDDKLEILERCQLAINATMRRGECCCSLGVAWGRDCNSCPQNGTGEFRALCGRDRPGQTQDIVSGVFEDINECVILPGVCRNGYCVNTFGSYRCFCDPGYEIDEFGYQCVDRNECDILEVCGEGVCVNAPGSFNCTCPDGYLLDESGTFCFEIREANCHLRVQNINETCSETLAGYYTRTQCCCSAAAPQGYGTGFCSACPRNGTDEYRRLCARGPGIGCTAADNCIDINECAQEPSPCIGGVCINTQSSFRCVCGTGYELDASGLRCVDIDECEANPCNANADCVNMDGAYRCYCPTGFEESADGKYCIDVDECALPLTCSNGTCHNQVGTYYCTCDVGFQLSYTRRRCDDIDECVGGRHSCPGVCTNTVGSYVCVCLEGTRASSDGTQCEDIDECAETRRICGNGNCANVYGTFHCYCPAGYELDKTGRNCQNVDECTTGSHDCRYSCTDNSGSYVCGCPEGYSLSGDNCLDINECYRDPGACGDNSVCVNSPGSFYCACLRGYQVSASGDECVDVDECLNVSSCGVNGVCENRRGSYRCSCRSGWDLYKNICYDRNCTRNTRLCPTIVGQCVNHICRCQTGFRYDRVTGACLGAKISDINECMETDIPCPGACQNTAGSYRCPCPPGMVLSGNTCLDQPVTPCVPGDCIYDCLINPDSVPLGGICGCKINEIPEKHRNYTLCVQTACLTGNCTRRRRSVSDELDEHEVFVRGNQPAGSCVMSFEPALKQQHGKIDVQIVDEFSPETFYLKEKMGVWSVCLRDGLKSGSVHDVHLHGFYLDQQAAYVREEKGEKAVGQMMNMKIHVLS